MNVLLTPDPPLNFHNARGLELSFAKPEPKWTPAFSWPLSASWTMSPDQGPLSGLRCALVANESYTSKWTPILTDLGAQLPRPGEDVFLPQTYVVVASEDTNQARVNLCQTAAMEKQVGLC